MEKARYYKADAVFFEAPRQGRPAVAQAFVYVSDGLADDPDFAKTHKQLWSWGGVPLVYRKTQGLVQLFRCAHKPDFIDKDGEETCKPYTLLKLAALINHADSNDAWWDAERLRNGTLWDDTEVCKELLSAKKSAHKGLIDAIKDLSDDLDTKKVLPKHLRRKLLILSLLIAYLEERRVFEEDYFAQFLPNSDKFFQVLADGKALVNLLDALEARFNGNVFSLEDTDREQLRNSRELIQFAELIEARKVKGGQLTLWQLYSFKDLPVELISHIYQLFVKDTTTAVYTPPFLVRFMLEEALSWKRLDRLMQRNEIILDPSCGSGVFLVEAYKRLVLHWRSRNNWKKPGKAVLKNLLKKVHGIDLEQGAVELAAFSLCLALCDALEPAEIRSSIKLFDPLLGETLHNSCFFEAREHGLVKDPIGVVTGNPPFKSSLTTPGAKRSYNRYKKKHGTLPDKQLAYLFLHEAMEMVADGGVLSMLQQANFLYNQLSLKFRRNLISKWDVREVLDFISVRGLFQKGDADPKVIVVVAEAATPLAERKILHATFRRSGRTDAELGFDLDYYDLHWLPRDLVLSNDGAWRANLLGGGRVLEFVDRLKEFRTLEEYAKKQGWDYGEGFIEGHKGKLVTATHITGKKLLPSVALTEMGIERDQITTVDAKLFKSAYTSRRFTPPMLLIRENMDLPHDVWEDHYLTFKAQLVGFCAPPRERGRIRKLGNWLSVMKRPLQAYIAAISPSLFSRKATAVCADEIFDLPYPENDTLDLSANEQLLVGDIVDYYRDLIRLGEDSAAMKENGRAALPDFNDVFIRQINAIYKKNPLHPCDHQTWPGVICQPFVFGKGKVDWSGAAELKEKLNGLLKEQRGDSLHITRIARIYDGNFIFLLKPDRLRYWLRSIALRDADETLADLQAQGF
ncbi:MAG: N-6 DNA methylase [Acidobacteria bacterium]|nr:N-6 DNA methylase [Acidobacteriota bacterium]